MLTDEQFLSFTRLPEHGGVNPGRAFLKLPALVHAGDTRDMASNLPILYGIVQGLFAETSDPAARRVLEIGTSDGTSTLALLKAASEANGHVDSIDVVDVPAAQALVDHFALRPFWTFHKGDARQVMTTLRDKGQRYVAIFLDGDHTYDGTKGELALADQMLLPGGVLFTHDNWCASIEVDWNKPFGQRAKRGSAQLAGEMVRGEEWVGVIFRFGCNLGVFRRRSEMLHEIDQNVQAGRDQGFFP